MKTIDSLLTYLESQGHGVTAREFRTLIEAERANYRASIDEALAKLDAALDRLNVRDDARDAAPVTTAATPRSGPGLCRRYEVKRLNDSDGKHADCEYFVLDWEHDPFSVPAALAYAAACEATHPELAKDLRQRAGRPVPGGGR